MHAFDTEVGGEKQILAFGATGSPRNRRRSAENGGAAFAIMVSSVTRSDTSRGDQARRQLFAEDLAEILFHFAFERGEQSFGNRCGGPGRGWPGCRSRVESPVRRAIATRASAEFGTLSSASTQRVAAVRRQHLIDRSIEQLARAQSREAPQAGVHHLAFFHLREQRVAELRLGLQAAAVPGSRRCATFRAAGCC